MADYYSVLAQAVVNLETEDAAAREELYERARSIIVVELRRQNPRISALTITREQAALEAAIRKLEMELMPARSKKSAPPPKAVSGPSRLSRKQTNWVKCQKRWPRCCWALVISQLSSASAAWSTCAVWRSSTQTSSNIRFCLAQWRFSYVY